MEPKILEAKIADDVEFGESVTVVMPSNLYGCKLGDHSFVGPFVEIQRDTRIGAHTRISSHSLICEKVDIGDHCFVSHGVMFANDLFKSGVTDPNRDNWILIRIGNYVAIGVVQ